MSAKIFIANLPKDADESEIKDIFAKYGEIKEVRLLTDKRTPYGFVDFSDPSVVDEVIKGENHREYKGQIIRVEKATGRSTRDGRDRKSRDEGHMRKTDYKIEVSHLPRRCTWQQLKDHMKKEGEVNYCSVDRDIGYVEYVHYEDMKSALRHLDDTKLVCGSESSYIHVYRYRSRSPSRHRSRSRSHRDSSYHRRSRSRSERRYDRSREAERDRYRNESRSRDRKVEEDRKVEDRKDSRSPERKEASRDSRSPPRKDSRSPSRDSRSVSRDSRSPRRNYD